MTDELKPCRFCGHKHLAMKRVSMFCMDACKKHEAALTELAAKLEAAYNRELETNEKRTVRLAELTAQVAALTADLDAARQALTGVRDYVQMRMPIDVVFRVLKIIDAALQSAKA